VYIRTYVPNPLFCWKQSEWSWAAPMAQIKDNELRNLPGISPSRWPDEFVKRSPKMLPRPILSKLMHYLNRGKSSPRMWAIFAIFKITAQSKKWRNGRNFANLVTLLAMHARITNLKSLFFLAWKCIWRSAQRTDFCCLYAEEET
jgi:hypothetical protein